MTISAINRWIELACSRAAGVASGVKRTTVTQDIYRMLTVVLAGSIFLCACRSADYPNSEESIRQARRHVEFLASDHLQGRGTPSRELDNAADYIAQEFKSCGLEPVNGSWYQNFSLYRTQIGSGNSLIIKDVNGAHAFEVERDYSFFEFSATTSLNTAGLAFAGYGITASEQKWDDYQGLDVRNKVVVVLAGEPSSTDSTFFDGYQLTRHAYTGTKLQAAQSHGAIGMIVIGDPRYNPLPDPAASHFSAENPRPKSIRSEPLQNYPLTAISDYGALRSIFFSHDDDLTRILVGMSTQRTPHSFALPQTISVTVSKSDEILPVRNVLGMLRGTDDSGYIVVGAHYDHLGVDPEGAAHSGGHDAIFNGADDNASGTAGVLLAARILSGMKERPKKSILFVCFTAEEKGLYGSQAFVQRCPINISGCSAMINMDMIGRNHSDSISIGGGAHFPALASMAKLANSKLSKPMFIAENIEKFYLRGDQASFANVGIPVVYLSSGLHADYHQPSDELSKIDFTKVARVSRLCAETAWMAAHGKQGELL